MMINRKCMMRYSDDLVEMHEQGVCGCGHEFDTNEIFMGYPTEDDDHTFVCLTCHFWYVHGTTE